MKMGLFQRCRWYFNRIRYISLADLLYRLKWKARQLTYDRLRAGKDNIKYSTEAIINIKPNNCFSFNKNPKEFAIVYSKLFDKKKLVNEADKYCRHIFSFYDMQNINVGQKINWQKDYKTNKSWDMVYCGNIDHNSVKTGDIKYVWELNRHHHFYALAKSYYLTKNEKYAKEIISEIETWIEQNPYLMGINWFSPLEASIRIISWSWALQLIRTSHSLDKEKLGKILKYIWLQSDFIYNNLSLYSSANNHLIGEAAALSIVSSLYPFFRHAEKWREKSKKILVEQFRKQIYDDGVGVEQAPNYLAFILDFYLQAKIIAGISFPQDIAKKIEQAGEFLMNIADLNQKSQIGDCAEDFVSALGNKNVLENYQSLLTTLSVLFKRDDFKFYGKQFDEKTFWLLGSSAIKDYLSIKTIEVKLKSKPFDNGGYYFLRNNNSVLLFDCGSLGYNLCASGHGHADSLSFLLSYKNKEFFVDSGTYRYHNGTGLRDYFRLTSAHNTAKINKTEQSEPRGNFIWGKKANSFVKNCYLDKDKEFVEGYHDGFKKTGVFHDRAIINDKKNKMFYINDKIIGKGNSKVELFFHVHPSVKISKKGDNIYVLKNSREQIEIIFDNKLSIEQTDGFYSQSYGTKKQAKILKATNKSNDKEFQTLIKLK